MTEEALYETMRSALLSRFSGDRELSDEAIAQEIDCLLLTHPAVRLLTVRERRQMKDRLFRSVRRLDILQELVDDPTVTEIMVNGPSSIFVERAGQLSRWERTFSDPEKLDDVIRKIAGRCNRVINERQPIVDARLPDGSRVNAVTAPVALNGPILTIRRFPEEAITLETLVKLGSLTEEAARLLTRLTAAGYSILVGGGTSAGKTTFLNALSACIPSGERVITIEDNAELMLQGIENLVRLEAKPANSEDTNEITIRDLIRSALRMRPDRIIVGEVRGEEAIDMLQAMNTGHDGSMSTLHANTAADLISRLETMVLMAFPLPLPAIRRQIASGVDLIVHLGRLPDRTRRVLEISEVLSDENGEPVLRPLFRFDPEDRRLVRTAQLKNLEKLRRAGLLPEDGEL